jgi:hypothetical protein
MSTWLFIWMYVWGLAASYIAFHDQRRRDVMTIIVLLWPISLPLLTLMACTGLTDKLSAWADRKKAEMGK